MIKGDIKIINKLGLHARAAAKLVNTASGFSSGIRLGNGSHWVDAKSIMSVMMLAASRGTTLEVEVDGADEKKAYAALEQLIKNRFGEDE